MQEMQRRVLRALDPVRLPKVERAIAIALALRFGDFVQLPELIDAVYGDRKDGGPLGADSIVVRACRRLAVKLGRAKASVRLERRGTLGRRLVWRKKDPA